MTEPRLIFITGAARGIGAETARLFLAKGWRVGASDVNADALAALGRESGSDRLSTHPADVRDFAAIESALGDFARSMRLISEIREVGCGVGLGGFGRGLNSFVHLKGLPGEYTKIRPEIRASSS